MGAEFKYNRVKTFPNTSKKESISIQVASIIMFKVPLLYALIGITLMAITDAHNGQNAAALDTEAVETPTTAIDRAKRLESDRPACVMLMGWCASDSEKLIGRASRRCLRKEASIYCKTLAHFVHEKTAIPLKPRKVAMKLRVIPLKVAGVDADVVVDVVEDVADKVPLENVSGAILDIT